MRINIGSLKVVFCIHVVSIKYCRVCFLDSVFIEGLEFRMFHIFKIYFQDEFYIRISNHSVVVKSEVETVVMIVWKV